MRVRMKATGRAALLAAFGVALILMSVAFAPRQARAEVAASVSYRIKAKGWKAWKKDGQAAGFSKGSKRVEGIQLVLSGQEGGVTYRIRQQSKKWQGWKGNGAQATVKRGKRIDAVQIKLTGAAATAYDVYYRVNVQNVGWMGWGKNGATVGATGYQYGIKGIQVKLVEKGGEVPPAKVSGKTQNYLLAHIKYSGSKYKSLKKLGIKGHSYDATANKLVNQEMDQMTEFLRLFGGGASYKSLSQYEKCVTILTYVGMTYGYKSGSTNVKSMILKRGGTCYGFSDLVYCLARKSGIQAAYLTKPGRNVDHWYGGMMRMYGSQHRTVVVKLGGKWYELDGNSAIFTADSGRVEPERITASYAKYLRGKSKKFSKINP